MWQVAMQYLPKDPATKSWKLGILLVLKLDIVFSNPKCSNSPTLAYHCSGQPLVHPWPPLAHQITQPLGCMLPWEAEQPVNCNKANVCCKYIMQLRTTLTQWDEIISEVAFLFQSKFCKCMYYPSLENTTIKIKYKRSTTG